MSDTNATNQKWYYIEEVPSFIIGVLTFIVVAIYTGYARQQVIETQNANSIARKAFAEANKPYLVANGINPNFTRDNAGNHFRVGFIVANSGNTPANNVIFSICDPIVKDGEVVPIISCNISEQSSGEQVLGPKQQTSLIGSIIKPEDFSDTEDGRKSIYIFGYVKYKDDIEFDENNRPEERITRFCKRVLKPRLVPNSATVAKEQITNPSAVNDIPAVPVVASLGCPSFNCTDSGCK